MLPSAPSARGDGAAIEVTFDRHGARIAGDPRVERSMVHAHEIQPLAVGESHVELGSEAREQVQARA